MKRTVLFLCATNGVHSPMAEALLRRIDSEHFESISAGIEPGQLHPLAIEAMREIGINMDGVTPSPVRAFVSRDVDFVITLCDRAKANCPEFPGAECIHWRFEDPLAPRGPERQERAFRILRDQIAQRLHLFVLVQVRIREMSTSTRPAPLQAKHYLTR